MSARKVIRGVLGSLLYPAVLFGTAGTLAWVEGWIFLAVTGGMTIALFRWLAQHDPALLAERQKGLWQPGQPTWDRVILILFSLSWFAWLALPGLDAVRFAWSHVPLAVKLAGGVAYVLGWMGIVWTHRANTYLAPVVRVQTERDHQVIDTGPYAIVRHPMYAAFLLWMPGASLLLGSLYATAASLVPMALLGVRTYLEDECLARDLPGYAEYRTRVRHRLIPGIW